MMKVFLAALTAVLLLSFTSATYAHGKRHERESLFSRNDTPVSVRLLLGTGWGPAYGKHMHDQRFRGWPPFMRNWPFWKKVRYMQKMNYRYGRHSRHDRHDKHARHDRHRGHDRHDRDDDHRRHDRDGRYDRGNWYDKYFK